MPTLLRDVGMAHLSFLFALIAMPPRLRDLPVDSHRGLTSPARLAICGHANVTGNAMDAKKKM